MAKYWANMLSIRSHCVDGKMLTSFLPITSPKSEWYILVTFYFDFTGRPWLGRILMHLRIEKQGEVFSCDLSCVFSYDFTWISYCNFGLSFLTQFWLSFSHTILLAFSHAILASDFCLRFLMQFFRAVFPLSAKGKYEFYNYCVCEHRSFNSI